MLTLPPQTRTYLKSAFASARLADAVADLLESAAAVVEAPVDSATVISEGDLVWLDTDDVKPASAFPWDTDLATTQAAFAAVFLGVALENSAAGQTNPIGVCTSPLMRRRRAAVSATYNIGDDLGPDEDPAQKLSNTRLEHVMNAGLAIARSVEHRASASTSLLVTFASAFHTATANSNAAIG